MRRVIKIGRNPRTNFQPSKSENGFDLIIYEVPTLLKADTADYLMRKTWRVVLGRGLRHSLTRFFFLHSYFQLYFVVCLRLSGK